MMTWTVRDEEAGQSLLQILQRRLPVAPAGYLRQLIKKGRIGDGSGAWSEERRAEAGERIELPDSSRLQELLRQVPAALTELRVLYQSREILVIDKPAGLAIHAGVGHEGENLTDVVAAYLRQRGERFQVAPVHRLDLETSGPVVFGKGRKACGELGRLFQAHAVEKFYLAAVKGCPPGSGLLDSPVKSKGKMRAAETRFTRIATGREASLLELQLVTGRQHQIRQQLARAGHPLLGDQRYGGPQLPGLTRTFLHCRKIAFADPFSGAPLVIESELPPDLQRLWQELAPAS